MLDYIGDIGGLLDGLRIIVGIIIAPVSSYNFTSTLLSKLFSITEDSAPDLQESNATEVEADVRTVAETCRSA